MANEKCCCNCLHCARWQTSKGVECHCDLNDRYLGYMTVMDTDNECDNWEKETKFDMQEKHDKEIYNQALDDFRKKANNFLNESSDFADFVITDNAIDCICDELRKE